MKVAIVHDYLFQFGGGEKVVESWLRMYPQADLWTSFFVAPKFTDSAPIQQTYTDKRLKTTWLQFWFGTRKVGTKIKLGWLNKYTKHFFWLYPLVMSCLTIQNYDLVIISSTYPAKYVKLKNCHKIIHYCHSPTRFLYGLVTEVDHQTIPLVYRLLLPFFKLILKHFDLYAVKRLNRQGTLWITNSKNTQAMVQKVYQTTSQVIYPPVQIEHFLALPKRTNYQDPYYYYFGRISFHKRLDLAIQACLELGRKLFISGVSAYPLEMKKLERIVTEFEQNHPEKTGLIKFLGRSSDQERDELLSGCLALLFPGKEDFGIAPIEALASGTPVIAYQAGGALEYIRHRENGIFFQEQTVESLKSAILLFESQTRWDEQLIRQSAKNFSEANFQKQFSQITQF